MNINYSQLIKPLTEKLRKDASFEWTKDMQHSFNKLKLSRQHAILGSSLHAPAPFCAPPKLDQGAHGGLQ